MFSYTEVVYILIKKLLKQPSVFTSGKAKIEAFIVSSYNSGYKGLVMKHITARNCVLKAGLRKHVVDPIQSSCGFLLIDWLIWKFAIYLIKIPSVTLQIAAKPKQEILT